MGDSGDLGSFGCAPTQRASRASALGRDGGASSGGRLVASIAALRSREDRSEDVYSHKDNMLPQVWRRLVTGTFVVFRVVKSAGTGRQQIAGRLRAVAVEVAPNQLFSGISQDLRKGRMIMWKVYQVLYCSVEMHESNNLVNQFSRLWSNDMPSQYLTGRRIT